jgi:hypothetical protein
MHITIIVRNNLLKNSKKKTKKPQQHRYGLMLADLMPDCWLEVKSASGRFCNRPARSRFSMVFLGPRASAELVPKFHVALHASHVALHCTLKISPYTNVTLTFDFGLHHPFHGGYG